MKKIVFLDADTLGTDINLQPLKKLGDFIVYPSTQANEVVARIGNAEVVIVNKVRITKEIMDACPNLNLICVAATGVNNVDTEYAKQKMIKVKNAVNYSTNSVTQVTFSILFEIILRTNQMNAFVRSGGYSKSGMFTYLKQPFFEIKDKRFGIIGMGNIGKNVANIAKTFGAEVCYYSTSGRNNSATQYLRLQLDELLQSCDIISIHAPLNERTNNLITKNKLEKMKRTAILLNMGRGGIVNEADLANALDNDVIAAAGVDVFVDEPLPQNHPYLNMQHPEKILLTPHIGWASFEARKCLLEKIVENIKNN